MKTKTSFATPTNPNTLAGRLRTTCAARLLPLLLLLTLPAVVQAQFTFVTNNGAITITGYTGSGGAVIPSTTNGLPVTSIGDSAFHNNPSLTSVTIPNSVISIGSYAFQYCYSLTSVTIGNGVTSIASYTFQYCSSLTSVTIGTNVTSIGSYAFDSCISLTSVTIPNSVISIGTDAFSSCTSLTSVMIPNSVISIGSYAFYFCTNLTSVTIPNSVISIGSYAFFDCTSLTNVTIGNSVTSIGDYAFEYCGLTSVTIPNSVTSIGTYAFQFCWSLTSVTIGNSVTSIGIMAFSFCGLTSVTIPNSVTSIGDDAFYGCYSLTNVTIGNSVTSIGNTAFQNCTSLTAITVDALNPSYSSVAGVLFNKSTNTLIQCPGGKAGSYTVPDSVTSIGSGAFAYCPNLTKVTIGNGVTSIASYTFQYCSSLTSVTIPDSITSIGSYAFRSCTSLTGVYFQGNAPSLSSSVFDGDNNATVYYLPGKTGWGTPGTLFGGRPTQLWDPSPSPTIITASPLPAGVAGTAYSTNLAAIGSTSPYIWSLAAGNLPAGLSLSTNGVISGTPGLATNASFTVQVVGGNGLSTNKVFGLMIGPAITTTSPLPAGAVGVAYNQTLAASGGTSPYVWIITAGGLPTGLNLSTNGAITGTPTMLTNASFTVRVTDNSSLSSTKSFTLAIAVVLADALNTSGMTWTNGGNVPWFGQTATTHDGVAAAQSGHITDSQESWMQTTLTGPGTLTYWRKVSSESGYDFLEFYLDGVLQTGRISGTVDWQKQTNNIPAGTHTVKWRYMKDPSVSVGSDCGWVDEVSYILSRPSIITTNGSLGISNGLFGFTVSGPASQTNVVEGSTNLLNWTPLKTNVMGGSPVYFSDPDWANYPDRFYRLRSP